MNVFLLSAFDNQIVLDKVLHKAHHLHCLLDLRAVFTIPEPFVFMLLLSATI